MLTIDDFLEQRIGQGRYQYLNFFCLGFALFIDGFQTYFLVYILPIQGKELDLSHESIEMLSVIQFVGMVISYLLLSVLSDKVGRRKLLLAGMLVSGISMLGLSFMDTVAGIAIFRFLVGCTIGIIMGGSLVLLVEVVIAKRRGVAIVGGELCYIFGLVYTTLFCMATFTSFDEGNWRFGLQLNSLFSFLSFTLIYFKSHESPRFYMVKQMYDQGWRIFTLIGKMNKGDDFTEITEKEKSKPSFKALFGSAERRQTCLIWMLSLELNFLDKGLLILMPFIFLESKQSLVNLLIAHSVEIPAALISGIIIDSKRFGGRVRGLQVGFFLLNMSMIVLLAIQSSAVLFAFFVVRFSIRWLWAFYNPLVMETYSTMLRTVGTGGAQMIGKVAGSLTPLIVLPIYFANSYGVFMFLLFFGLSAHLLLCFFPKDLTRQQLDKPKTQRNDLQQVPQHEEPESGPIDQEIEIEAVSMKELN